MYFHIFIMFSNKRIHISTAHNFNIYPANGSAVGTLQDHTIFLMVTNLKTNVIQERRKCVPVGGAGFQRATSTRQVGTRQ